MPHYNVIFQSSLKMKIHTALIQMVKTQSVTTALKVRHLHLRIADVHGRRDLIPPFILGCIQHLRALKGPSARSRVSVSKSHELLYIHNPITLIIETMPTDDLCMHIIATVDVVNTALPVMAHSPRKWSKNSTYIVVIHRCISNLLLFK